MPFARWAFLIEKDGTAIVVRRQSLTAKMPELSQSLRNLSRPNPDLILAGRNVRAIPGVSGRRIERCWEATQAPSRPKDRGGVVARQHRLIL